MKNIWKIGLLLIICALLCITVVTATGNNNLSTKDDVSKFIDEQDGKSASDVMNNVKEDHPTWKADLIENGDDEAIALYYEDSDSSKGYGSIYFKDGEVVSPSSLSGYELRECYKGELEDSDKCVDGSCDTDLEEKENDTDAVSDEEDTADEECKDGSCNKDSESKDVAIASDSKLTVEERKASFMEFLENKDSVTLEEVQDELDKCFPDDMEA